MCLSNIPAGIHSTNIKKSLGDSTPVHQHLWMDDLADLKPQQLRLMAFILRPVCLVSRDWEVHMKLLVPILAGEMGTLFPPCTLHGRKHTFLFVWLTPSPPSSASAPSSSTTLLGRHLFCGTIYIMYQQWSPDYYPQTYYIISCVKIMASVN